MTDLTTDPDGVTRRASSRYVGPDAWYAAAQPAYCPSLAASTFVEALAHAASGDGWLVNVRPNVLFEQHVTAVMRNEEDPPDWKIPYSRFLCGVYIDLTHELMADGFLAHRGNGDTVDYRLTLP